jgi:hypothetical protein
MGLQPDSFLPKRRIGAHLGLGRVGNAGGLVKKRTGGQDRRRYRVIDDSKNESDPRLSFVLK